MAKDVTSAEYNFRNRGKSGKLRTMEIEKGANGGFVVTHRFANNGGESYRDSEIHPLAKGADLLAHVARHMGIPGASEEKGEKEHEAK